MRHFLAVTVGSMVLSSAYGHGNDCGGRRTQSMIGLRSKRESGSDEFRLSPLLWVFSICDRVDLPTGRHSDNEE